MFEGGLYTFLLQSQGTDVIISFLGAVGGKLYRGGGMLAGTESVSRRSSD